MHTAFSYLGNTMHITIHLPGPVGERDQCVNYEEGNTKAKIDVDAYLRASYYVCC